ncbi:hypothetical protein QR98_0024440, partial [Sarcoptes scabiei]
IREFTKSPPKPNEKRQGVVLHHHNPTIAEIYEISKQLIDHNDSNKIQKTSLNENESSSNETTNSCSSIKASSGDATTNNSLEDSTPSPGSELGNDEASTSTATPDQISETGNRNDFGAIASDRSRNPSWTTYTISNKTAFR